MNVSQIKFKSNDVNNMFALLWEVWIIANCLYKVETIKRKI